MRNIQARFIVCASLLMLAACGGGKPSSGEKFSADLASLTSLSSDQATEISKIANSKSYTGQVLVVFKDDTDIRLNRDGKFISGDQKLADKLNEVVVSLNVKPRRYLQRFSESEIRGHRARLLRTKKVILPDLTRRFVFKTEGSKVVSLADQLTALSVIETVKPQSRVYISSSPTPSDPYLTQQSYLLSYDEALGLNVENAWKQYGVRGDGITLFDVDVNWNFNHEDLPVSVDDWVHDDCDPLEQVGCDDLESNPATINHGTGVSGILGGLWNDKGISGVAPDSSLKLVQTTGSVDESLNAIGVAIGKDVPNVNATSTWIAKEGDIVLIEVQTSGPTTGDIDCGIGSLASSTGTGCIPVESDEDQHKIVQSLVEAGIVVIEGAGNGTVDLDDKETSLKKVFQVDYMVKDSGAILVASVKPDGTKEPSSNWGSRIDVHGWGSDVVTSGYGDLAGSGNSAYTAKFSGTSSATAMVAGVASLIQSHVKKMYNDGTSIEVPGYGTFTKVVYFDSKQMRQLLKETGHAPTDSTYMIGNMPDAAAAIAAVEAGTYIPTIKIKREGDDAFVYNGSIEYKHNDPVKGVRFDMDGDSRSDLIRWSGDRWMIDLSSIGTSEDKFGDVDAEWVLNNDEAAELSTMTYPVVADYDGDGRVDVAVYDGLSGKYYIRYSPEHVETADWNQWDVVIDYSQFDGWRPYMRPVVGFYNADNWLDVGFQGPDGVWRIDFGGREYPTTTSTWKLLFENGLLTGKMTSDYSETIAGEFSDDLGTGFDQALDYISADLKSQAPGWAFQGVAGSYKDSNEFVIIKHPDTLASAGTIQYSDLVNSKSSGTLSSQKFVYGDNDVKMVGVVDLLGGDPTLSFWSDSGISYIDDSNSFKAAWVAEIISDYSILDLDSGGCAPMLGDYDGDKVDDVAAMCGGKWQVVYSDGDGSVTEIPFDLEGLDLPSQTFAGGIKYQTIKDLYAKYKKQLPKERDGWTCEDLYDIASCPSDMPFPPPVGPHFVDCIKNWSPNAAYCWDK